MESWQIEGFLEDVEDFQSYLSWPIWPLVRKVLKEKKGANLTLNYLNSENHSSLKYYHYGYLSSKIRYGAFSNIVMTVSSNHQYRFQDFDWTVTEMCTLSLI